MTPTDPADHRPTFRAATPEHPDRPAEPPRPDRPAEPVVFTQPPAHVVERVRRRWAEGVATRRDSSRGSGGDAA